MTGLDKNCKWHFAQSLGGQDQGPNEAMGQNFKKDPFESLVRESVQNSIDAALDDSQPVVMSFNFKHVSFNEYPKLFALKGHIRGCLTLFDDDSAKKKFQPMLDYLDSVQGKQVDYLEISDQHTTGMEYAKNDTKCGFYSFVKSAGNSSKPKATAGGSYGFGKAAYFNISKLRTILISTKTSNGNLFFEGVSSFCTHIYDDVKRVPVGFYCVGDDEEPVANESDIPELFLRKDYGTSMYIMGLDFKKSAVRDAINRIKEAALRHFWMAILRGKLVFRIGVEDDFSIIDASNLQQWVADVFPDFDDLRRGHKNPRPYLEAVANEGKDSNHLHFHKSVDYLGEVDFYMLRCKTGNDYILNMRSPLMLVNHQLNGSKYGFYSVFLCTDDNGNKLLRLAENPAHNEWDVDNAPEQDKSLVWLALEAKKNFIKECIQSQFVSTEDETITFGGLDEFLSIPTDVQDQEYHPDFGEPCGDESFEETGSSKTNIDEGEKHEPKKILVGEVKIRKPKNNKVDYDEGDEQLTGHVPEKKPQQENESEDDKEDDEEKKEEENEEKEPRNNHPEDNDQPDKKMDDNNEGELFTQLDPLRIGYRGFAQTVDNVVEHRLVVHSNRAANNVIIEVLSGGENGDEKLDLAYTDNGFLAGHRLTKVHLNEGKNEITIRFFDNMRHAIKLSIYEN